MAMLGYFYLGRSYLLKTTLSISVLALLLAVCVSCKKQRLSDPARCGTSETTAAWVKDFNTDSFQTISAVSGITYGRYAPGKPYWDTTYNPAVSIAFYPNGTGLLNGSSIFSYQLSLTSSYPRVRLYNIGGIGLLYPFTTRLQTADTLVMTVDQFSSTGCTLHYSSGSTNDATSSYMENSYLNLGR
jgi:hypothetical protein